MLPPVVSDLIDRFERNKDSYKSTSYKEAQLRQEFINPFWEELGWDMTNRQGLAEAYKEVIHEDSIKIDGQSKAPDYVFRVGSEKKFFLEVKAPKVDLAKDVAPAFQLKRYAWSAGLGISLLTDFEEFAVYQTTAVPKLTDAPHKDRIEYFRFDKYPEKWDWLAETFSRDAIWKGRFDKYTSAVKGKRGTTPFDKKFLADMLDWRMTLAKNIALRNPGLSEAELNFAVQVTLDRIIMLRICEDRGIEQYGNLAIDAGIPFDGTGIAHDRQKRKATGIYKNLLKRFALADDRFNSGLFHFRKEKGRDEHDALTPKLTIDDKTLEQIVRQLYYPESPYEFAHVPSDILGHVYEQFLGQVITLTRGHQARVEEKPEVKKAGGVYYTPTYIVDYIVKNTVGVRVSGSGYRVSEGRESVKTTPRTPTPGTRYPIPDLKILDPACGSGSFLLGAYQYLLDWYLKFYLDTNPESWEKKKILDRVGRGPGSGDRGPGFSPPEPGSRSPEPVLNYVLSIAERKRILLDHIHGVDIDRNAVEVAKLNLMLKVLEGDKSERRLAYDTNERLLPDLDANIVCGNSLIGLDYFDQLETEPDMAERAKINAMDWRDVFPDIMKRGGFDVVIGNPPYIRIQALRDAKPPVSPYYERAYITAKGKYDIYVLFIERTKALLSPQGVSGFIIPNKFLVADYGAQLRELLTKEGSVAEIVSFEEHQVFEGATIYTCLLFWSNIPKDRLEYIEFKSLDGIQDSLKSLSESKANTNYLRTSFPQPKGSVAWQFSAEADANVVLEVAKKWPKLQSYCERVFQGIITGGDQYFIFKIISKNAKTVRVWSPALEKDIEIENGLLHPFLRGSQVRRYKHLDSDMVILFPYRLEGERTVLLSETEIKRIFPLGWKYLVQVRDALSDRGSERMHYPSWYSLWNARDIRLLNGPKLLVPTIASKPSFAADLTGDFFFLGSGAGGPGAYGIVLSENIDPLYAMALLNSKLVDIFMRATSSVFSGGYYAYSQQYLWEIPFRPIDKSSGSDLEIAAQLKRLVSTILKLNMQKDVSAQDRTLLDRQLSATDREIDRLVYALYGLSEGEIRIVEGDV